VTTAGSGYDAAIVVAGEQPYAEMNGDLADPSLGTIEPTAVTAINGFATANVPVILVLISGRPLILEPALLAKVHAVVAAWLPGTEGAGVSDILFGNNSPTGTLPVSWPRAKTQLPINIGDASYDPLYPYGYGIHWW
jgi:beta-glucosidase